MPTETKTLAVYFDEAASDFCVFTQVYQDRHGYACHADCNRFATEAAAGAFIQGLEHLDGYLDDEVCCELLTPEEFENSTFGEVEC